MTIQNILAVFLDGCTRPLVLLWVAFLVAAVAVGLHCAFSHLMRKYGKPAAVFMLSVALFSAVVADKPDTGGTNAPPNGAQRSLRVDSRKEGVAAARVVSVDGALSSRMMSILSNLPPNDGPVVEPFAVRPANAVENAWWRARGAHVDGLTIPAVGWSFRTPAGFLDSLLVYSYGEIQPDVETAYFPRPFPEADLSLLPEGRWGMLPREGEESLFWHATSPSNSLILTWQNAAYDRDANCPTNLQIELFSNGTYVYRYDDHTEHHAVEYPFDLDGDGLENSVDPDPLTPGNDAHGTNAEWYDLVCSDVFSKTERPNSLPIPLPGGESVFFKPGVNTNAYYFVDVVAERGPAPIYFNSSHPGRLGSPVVVALAGETNRVPLLIGATYSVTSDVPFTVACPTNGFAEVAWDDGVNATVRWPLSFTFTEEISGTGRSYMVGVEPFDPGGTFSWGHNHGGATLQNADPPLGGGSCGCVSGNGTTVTFGCSPSCTCGGNCLAVGAFNMEHALFVVTGGVCHCGIEVAHSVDSEIPSVVDRLSIDIPPVLLVKDSWMPGSRSAMATVSLELSSRRSGELRIWIEHGSEKVILPVGADRRMPLSNVLAWSCSFVIDGVVPSEEEGDVRVCCAFDGLRDEAATTVVSTQRVELPTAPVTGMAVLKGTGVPVAVVLNPSIEGVRVEWHTARRKRQNIYDPWICVIQGERNVIVPTPESGIFALRARLVCGTQSNQVEYVHQVDERWSNAGREFIGPNKAGMRNHFGVASTSLLLKIRKSALDQMESTAYAYAAFLPARNGFAAIPADRWKCNAFVADMAIEAGATIRPRNPVQGAISGNYFPPLANDWANGDVVIQGWEFLGRDVYPEPGFVVGFPNAQGSGHVGIVDYDGWTISARPFAVTRYARKMLDSRCGYNRPTEEENENEK